MSDHVVDDCVNMIIWTIHTTNTKNNRTEQWVLKVQQHAMDADWHTVSKYSQQHDNLSTTDYGTFKSLKTITIFVTDRRVYSKFTRSIRSKINELNWYNIEEDRIAAISNDRHFLQHKLWLWRVHLLHLHQRTI